MKAVFVITDDNNDITVTRTLQRCWNEKLKNYSTVMMMTDQNVIVKQIRSYNTLWRNFFSTERITVVAYDEGRDDSTVIHITKKPVL